MVFKTKTTIYRNQEFLFYFLASLFPLSIPIVIDLLVLLEVLEADVVDFIVSVVTSSVECCTVEVIMVVFAKSEILKNTFIYEMTVYRDRRKGHPRGLTTCLSDLGRTFVRRN